MNETRSASRKANNDTEFADPDRGRVYRISVQGKLDASWSEWFCDLSIVRLQTDQPFPVTVLTGRIADQTALRGILNRIWDLNLSLISVETLENSGRDQV